MKKLLRGFALLLVLTSATPNTVSHASTEAYRSIELRKAAAVYMCANGKTEVYHGGRDCAALRRCSYEVKVLTPNQAKAKGLRGCMKCY